MAAAAVALPPATGQGAKFTRAEVTKIVNEVQLLLDDSTSRPASIGSVVSGTTAVRTGQRSRTQLQFPDRSIVRLGSNSVFSFLQGKREVDLKKGALLMQVPKSLGRTRTRTAAISAAITGTTIMIEYVPPVLDAAGKIIKPGTLKIIVIEGSFEFSLNSAPRRVLKLKAGEMVAFRSDAKRLPKKFVIDLDRLIKTSKLIEGGMGPLPDLPLMNREVVAQNRLKKTGRLVEVGSSRTPKGRPPLPGGTPGQDINTVRTVVNSRPMPPPDGPAPADATTSSTCPQAATAGPRPAARPAGSQPAPGALTVGNAHRGAVPRGSPDLATHAGGTALLR